MKIRSRILLLLSLAQGMGSLLATSCGKAGDKPYEECAICGPLADIRGSIAARSGSQSLMQGWVLASFEQDSLIARVAEADNAGLFTLKQMRTDSAQTLALFTPDYILQAMLAVPSKTEKRINQFFTVEKPSLPLLINNGPIITFQNLDGIKVSKEEIADQNGDGIPDGAPNIQGISLAAAPVAVDTDRDGIINAKDGDIDGDGIANVFDPDDDGDGVLDVFDGDQNSDLVNDTAPGGNNIDLYFKDGVEWIAVQYELKPKEDGSGNETSIKFLTKVKGSIVPNAVQIRGAPSLLNSATYMAQDSLGANTVQPWNRLLADDGLNEDSAPGDRLFARRVILAQGKTPRAYETVFFQLAFGAAKSPWYMEFAYLFPPVKPAPITAQYDSVTRSVLLVGDPFGGIQDFVWTITLWNGSGKVVWTSQGVPGNKRQFQIQENVVVAGESYKFSISAQSLDKISGYPAYIVQSPKYDLK